MVSMSDGADLSVGQAARRLGVTVRTLHHWDEIGLAEPSVREGSGYRRYAGSDMERLQRIVVYRELGIGLEDIRIILDGSALEAADVLRTQRARLGERIEELRRRGDDVERLIDAYENGLTLTVREQVETFGSEWDPRWPLQARERYGDTVQWQQYAERSAKRDAAEWARIARTVTALDAELAAAVAAGVEPGSERADSLVDRHREVFSQYFPLTRSMQVCLGRMYEADPAFTAHYDGVHPGLAAWLRRAIDARARSEGLDPDAVTWE